MWWKTARTRLDLTRRGRIMGILNVTPDSFSDGGRHSGPEAALEHARRMISDGAEIIDVGGESTRPGAPEVSTADEIARTVPVIAALRAEWDGCISIDTSKAAVAKAAVDAGADIVNDVSGLTADPAMAGVCVESGCGVVIMHMKGDPRTMQVAPVYEDVVAAVDEFFKDRLTTLVAQGIDPETICFDPGIGFGKTVEHNLALLRALDRLEVGGRPLLLGVSRKSFIGRVLESNEISDRSWPTVAITAWGLEAGVPIHRVHEVKPNVQAMRMTEAIMHGVA